MQTDIQKPKKILIIRLGAIGDVVHTTIIASAIKFKHPNWQVHYLTQSNIAPILDNHPHIDKVISWDRTNKKSIKQFLEICKITYAEKYDIVFNLTYSLRNILFSLFAVPKRIAFRKYLEGSWVKDYFYTAQNIIKDIVLPIRLYLGFNKDAIKQVSANVRNYQRPYFVIAPGGDSANSRQGRIWDIKNWKILCKNLLLKYNGTVFVIGSSSEKIYHEQLKSDNIIVFSGKYNLRQSSALISMADIVISGDTGPIHIASAYNKKTLALLGSTSPNKIKPYGENGYYIDGNYNCKYCWRKRCKYLKAGEKYTPCMQSISPNLVMQKLSKILINND